MATTWKPVDAEIWACSLALERYTANRPILGETKTINTVAEERLSSSWYECAVATLLEMGAGYRSPRYSQRTSAAARSASRIGKRQVVSLDDLGGMR